MYNYSGYDKTNPKSIEKYSQGLIGKTFRQIVEEDEANKPSVVKEELLSYGNANATKEKKNKGKLGQLIEERFFHYPCNSDSRPDFHEAGVELKVSPYRINKDGSKVAKERLILTMIDYFETVNESFEDSHLWKKSKLILLVYYLFLQDTEDRLDYRIDYSRLFTPPEQDLKIIQHDFEVIVEKIRMGKAHELSEGDTMYLGAATKSATSKNLTKQPYSDVLAKPRAFAFKTSYMTYVLNNYIIPGKYKYESIMKYQVADSFEDYVVKRIGAYVGLSVDELCIKLDVKFEKMPKNLNAMLAYRMLGVKGNHAEEFEKANIAIKTIRIQKSDSIKENMSFPTFMFMELIKEDWDDCTFGNYLRETRFLFIVFKEDEKGCFRLRGCQFWNIPYNDLENDVRSVWEKTKKVIQDGLKVVLVNGRMKNNLPKQSENRVCHVRPHALNAKDTYELPDGRQYPKQCFWLNNSYIYDQLNKEIKG